MSRKRIAIVIVSVLAVIVIIAVIIKIATPQDDPKDAYLKKAVQTTIDKDTGEQITKDPNLGPQSDETRAVTILGLEPVVQAGALGEQIDFIKDAINRFAKENLNNKYSTITVRPQNLVASDGVITTSIRLGQSDEILPITITAKNTGETQVVISDPSNKYGGSFDSDLTVFGAD